MPNQAIKCQVTSCRHNAQSSCDLKSVQIGNTVSEASRAEETECNSFEM
jgi:hypothetical protein